MRIVFSYIAQVHQTLHSLPIAMEIAQRYPEIEVHLVCMTETHLTFIKSLASYYPKARVHFHLLYLPKLLRTCIERYGQTPLSRLICLFLNRHYFSSFKCIVVTEETSLYLRWFGVCSPALIWTMHGAGDRNIGFSREVRGFDYVLMAGHKQEQRFLANQAIRPGHYCTGVYAKFDIVSRIHQKKASQIFFANNRPTILYNPHFVTRFSSWHRFGFSILHYFAHQDRYNFIFAPHYRLFDRHKDKARHLIKAFGHYSHMLIDPGSLYSVDMTYTSAADLYMGDVSSQVTEFLVIPRPCLFLNAHNAQWKGNENYLFWTLGLVRDSIESLQNDIEEAFLTHDTFVKHQKQYIQETFSLTMGRPTASIGADAIVHFLNTGP
ncbi:MAG: sensor domain-containing protein [Acetobacter sp.]|nr:sensor domain-containing protein [Acetobacter sp.]